MKKILFFTLFIALINIVVAQNVGIGTTTPKPSAQLDISATNKGILIPRVSLLSATDVVTIPSPSLSLLVYNTNIAGAGVLAVSEGYYYWNDIAWIPLVINNNSANVPWLLGGNTGTVAGNNYYMGTSDLQPLLFKIKATNAGYLGLDGNTYWGYKSGFNSGAGYSNVAVGGSALYQNTNRSNLVAVGDSALYNNGIGATLVTEATGNTAIGSKALFTNRKGYYNTAVGSKTLYNNTTGNYNTATGVQSLFYDTSGSYNTSMGYQALTNNTNGNNNTASGFQSLLSNTTGINNTANGASSLVLTSTGANNTTSGYLSLFSNTTGNNNTAAGASSLISNSTGYSNVGVGINTLYSNTTGSNLVAIGDSSLYNNGIGATVAQGKENTAIGSKALISNTIGNGNLAIGSHADVATNNLNNATAIGNKSVVNCSNCLVLGSINGLNGAASSVKVGIGTSTPLMGLHVVKTDSAVALFENTQTLDNRVSNALYFKTGNSTWAYTGAIKTIGESPVFARLGFFTDASSSPNQLQERLSISNTGNVGIGTTTPTEKLDVKGDTRIIGNAVVIGNTTLNGNQAVNGDVTIYGTLEVQHGSVILPIKQVVNGNYTVSIYDYTIVVDMEHDSTSAPHIFLPATTTVGRVVKIVAINMVEKTMDPSVSFPYNGTVSIYNQTQNLNNRFDFIESHSIKEYRHGGSPAFIPYDIVTYNSPLSNTYQFVGGTVGWILTDLSSTDARGFGVSRIY